MDIAATEGGEQDTPAEAEWPRGVRRSTPSAVHIRDGWAIPVGTIGSAWLIVMDQRSPAEELPALYRAILDRVAELERTGQRAKAARVRSTATHIYSRAWDDVARRELMSLLRESAEPPSEPSVSARDVRSGRVATS